MKVVITVIVIWKVIKWGVNKIWYKIVNGG